MSKHQYRRCRIGRISKHGVWANLHIKIFWVIWLVKLSTFKTFVDIHTWTGLGAGFALFIAFYTGAITIFTEQVEAWESYVVATSPVQNYDQAQRLVDQVLKETPAAAANLRLGLSTSDQPQHKARWFEKLEDSTFKNHTFMLQEDGALSIEHNKKRLARFIYRLHYTAGLPSSFGLQVLGIICLIYGVALVSGVLIFLPSFLKNLSIVRMGANKKRFWLDTHNVIGVFTLPWHVMYAWSSALLALSIYFMAPFQFMVFDTDLVDIIGPDIGVVQQAEPSGKRSDILPVEKLVAIAQREVPNMAVTRLHYKHAGDSNGTVRLSGNANAGTLVPRAKVYVSTSTGEVLSVENPDSASVGSTFLRGLYSLHFADFSGYTVKIVYFVLGLAGAFLFYSGNLLWIESRRKRRTNTQPSATLLVARLNSGVCIGAMAGVSAAFLAARALAELPNSDTLVEATYYGVLFLSVAWSFYRPVAGGTRDLLYLCAVLTAGIPVFDAWFVDMPIWHSIATQHWVLVTVDSIAILCAASFWKMARSVDARAKNGAKNSVWSNQPSSEAVTNERLSVDSSKA